MKITFSVLIAAASLFIVTSNTSAQTSTRAPKINRQDALITKFEAREENLNERMQKLENRQASMQARFDTAKQRVINNILAHGKRMIEKAKNAVERIDSIWERLQNRINMIEKEGKDLSSVKDEIEMVSEKKQQALDAIDKANQELTKIENAATPKEAALAFREQFILVKKALREYQQSLINVLRNLKGMSGVVTPTQTPAP